MEIATTYAPNAFQTHQLIMVGTHPPISLAQSVHILLAPWPQELVVGTLRYSLVRSVQLMGILKVFT